MDARIREATLEDAEALARVIRSSFRDVAERFNLRPDTAPTHPSNCQTDWVQSDLRRGVSYYLLSSHGSVVGCVALELASGSMAYLERLAVVPEQRGQGFGAELVRHALQEARGAGASVVSVGIIAEHVELISWYGNLGFGRGATRRFSHLPFTVLYLEHVVS